MMVRFFAPGFPAFLLLSGFGLMLTIRFSASSYQNDASTEFKDLWHELKVPDLVDLPKELEREGLSTTDMLDAPISAAQLASSKDKKKKKGARKFRLQNTHLEGIDLSQDFVKPS